MKFSEEDSERLKSFYDKAIDKFGPSSYKSLGWNDEADKPTRFRALSQIADLSGHSILDVGCGFGDLYDYLKDCSFNFSYKGIDINPRAIEVARLRHPELEFEVADFGEYGGEGADFVLASGTLSFKVENYKEVYFNHIRKMFELSTIGAGFNMLDERYHVNDNTYAAYSLEEVDAFCSGLTDKIEIVENYLPQEFAVFLYH